MKFNTCVFRLALWSVAVLVTADNAPAQSFIFNNINSRVHALVYGPEPGNPYQQLQGNAPGAIPPGTQFYSGVPLLGSNYNVEAWYSLTPVQDLFALNPGARPVQDSLTYFPSSEFPGFFTRGERYIPDAIYTPSSSYPYMAYLQVRAWDNGGGQFVSWDQAWNAAQAGSGYAVGWSTTFEQPLTIGLIGLPPNMDNFRSFNLHVVPEPSAIVLALLGSLLLLGSLRSRRRLRKPM